MAAPSPMLSSASPRWPAANDWVMQPKRDGFRLIVCVDRAGRVRAWSRHGTSLTARVGDLLDGFSAGPAASVFDGELVSLTASDGQVVQDFAAVCRAVLNREGAAAAQLHFVAFDVLELAGEDLRSRSWTDRDARLRSALPVSDRVRVVQTRPVSREGHDAIVGLGFEGTVLKRPRSFYRSGHQTAWQKVKARHRTTARLRSLATARDGKTYAVCELSGRRVTALSSPQFGWRIGGKVELVYSRVDADARYARFAPRAPVCRRRSQVAVARRLKPEVQRQQKVGGPQVRRLRRKTNGLAADSIRSRG